MHEQFPDRVLYEPDEVLRLNRARLALRLNMAPSAIDDLPAGDVNDLMQVIWAEAEISQSKKA